jgi:hypothetical protein
MFRGRHHKYTVLGRSAKPRLMVSPTTAMEGTRLERRQRRNSTYSLMMRQ